MVRLGLLAPMKQGLNLCQTPLFALLGRRLTIAHSAAVRVGRQTVAYPGKSQNTRNQGGSCKHSQKKVSPLFYRGNLLFPPGATLQRSCLPAPVTRPADYYCNIATILTQGKAEWTRQTHPNAIYLICEQFLTAPAGDGRTLCYGSQRATSSTNLHIVSFERRRKSHAHQGRRFKIGSLVNMNCTSKPGRRLEMRRKFNLRFLPGVSGEESVS